MSRRKKNAGRGFGMMFHGAFGSKEEAKKKERAVHGFIQPRNIRGERRYVVMSERKNPIKRKKKNPMDLVVMGANPFGDPRGQAFLDCFDKDSATYHSTTCQSVRRRTKKVKGIPPWFAAGAENPCTEEELRREREAARKYGPYRRRNAEREVIVHPGETITLKVNPSSAEEIREEFTGREYEYTFISDEPHMRAGDYAQIGDMMGISFKPKNGGQVEAIGWYEGSDRIPLHEAAKSLRTLTDAPVLVSDTTRRQLYFVGGNQDLSPLILGYIDAGQDAKDGDIWELGDARTVVYREKKWMDKFRTINYQHRFGEENGRVPKLLYNARLKRLLIEGGDYEVRPEGIVN